MKFSTAFLLLAFVALAGCQSASPICVAEPGPSEAASAPIVVGVAADPAMTAEIQRRNAAAERALNAPVTIESNAIALGEVIGLIRALDGVNIEVNWPKLELVGIDRDSLATLHLTDVPAATALQIVLEQVSADCFEEDKAVYTIRNGIVWITTQRALSEETETRLYDIAWYQGRLETMQYILYHNHPRADELRAVIQQNYGPLLPPEPERNTSGDSGSLFGVDEDYEYDSREERIDQLRDLIESTAGDPDDWIDGQHTLYEIDDALVIKATPEVHAVIAALLAALRETQNRQFEQQARLIEVFLLLEEAEAYRLDQDYRRALVKIDQALRVDPHSPEANALRGIVVGAMSR